jgi:hypothetical protein
MYGLADGEVPLCRESHDGEHRRVGRPGTRVALYKV